MNWPTMLQSRWVFRSSSSARSFGGGVTILRRDADLNGPSEQLADRTVVGDAKEPGPLLFDRSPISSTVRWNLAATGVCVVVGDFDDDAIKGWYRGRRRPYALSSRCKPPAMRRGGHGTDSSSAAWSLNSPSATSSKPPA